MQILDAVPESPIVRTPESHGPQRRRAWIVASAASTAVALLLAGWYVADRYWPYRYRNVKPVLESVLASQITISEYHRTYFPQPGFVAEGLILRRTSAPDLPPVGSTGKLIVRGRWSDLLLLRNRIQLVDVIDLHVVVPPVGSRANHEDFPPGASADFAGPSTMVEEFRIHRARLDIQRTNGGLYSFPINNLVIRNLQQGQAISYTVDMQNATPAGHIVANGSFGPLDPKNLGATPVSGDFTFTQVQLSQIGELHGTLSASDHFQGTLAAISGAATTSVPDFAVNNGRPTSLSGAINFTINALNRDIQLQNIALKTGDSTVQARGVIVGAGAKTTNLDFSVTRGRIQDLLHPFLRGASPLAGPVSLGGHATLLPAQNGASFLQRLQITAALTAPAETMTNHATEQSLTAFSHRAAGNPPKPAVNDAPAEADVLSSISGHASLTNGVASTRDLRVQFPGASTTLAGTWNLHSTAAHLTGDLKMDTDISHVTTGFKSLLLKPLAPFFKRGKSGAVIPVAFTGASGNYKVSQNIFAVK